MPQVGNQFFNAMIENRLDDAENLATTMEDPFFTKAIEFGWHRSLKGALSIKQLMPGFERAPFPPLNQTEIAELTKLMKDSSLL